jgi:uncharacterized protein
MQDLSLALLLGAILLFLASPVRKLLRARLHGAPVLVWTVPAILTAAFAAAAALSNALSVPLILLVLGYSVAPVLCAYVQGAGFVERPTVLDFASILLIWLPLEFAAGHQLIPKPAQGFLHSVAYGIAILLGLVLFLCFRSFPGLKYDLPSCKRDAWLPLAGYAVAAPVLIALGIAIGFIPLPHLPTQTSSRMAGTFGLIFVGTAIPEEILFRSLIQNLLMLRYGESARTLITASVIFGCAHLDNGPQPLPNWRYAILATIAGIAYGKVFQKASSVVSSACLHALVDWTKHFFF